MRFIIEEAIPVLEQGINGKSLHFPSNFAVNQRLLYKWRIWKKEDWEAVVIQVWNEEILH